MKKVDKMTCKTCYFLKKSETYEGADFECHRFPPLAQTEANGYNVWAHFPLMDKSDWCGEYKKKIVKTKKGK